MCLCECFQSHCYPVFWFWFLLFFSVHLILNSEPEQTQIQTFKRQQNSFSRKDDVKRKLPEASSGPHLTRSLQNLHFISGAIQSSTSSDILHLRI